MSLVFAPVGAADRDMAIRKLRTVFFGYDVWPRAFTTDRIAESGVCCSAVSEEVGWVNQKV